MLPVLLENISLPLNLTVDKVKAMFVQCDLNGANCKIPTLQQIVFNLSGYDMTEILEKDFNAQNLISFA